MAKVSCPYCYHRIDGSRLWFQCSGRAAPGRPACARKPDPDRARETRFFDAVLPSFPPPGPSYLPVLKDRVPCPNCHGMTAIRVCPCCHTPVTQNFGKTKSPLIAMVGAKGTGKTIYLIALTHIVRNSLGERFGADVRLIAKPPGFEPEQVFRDRRLMPQTASAIEGRSEPIIFEWRRPVSLAGVVERYQTTYLSFYDTAGEDLSELQRTQDLTYLGAADALILLLDPFQIPQARNLIKIPESEIRSNELTVDVVNRVTETLLTAEGKRGRFNRNIKIPVAVAFSKIDAFFRVLGETHPLVQAPAPLPAYDETAGRRTHEYVRAMLYEWGASQIDRHLSYNYTNFRYFAVSSLGAEPDYEAETSGTPVSEAGVRPFRVDEPLVWLLSQFDLVPTVEGQ